MSSREEAALIITFTEGAIAIILNTFIVVTNSKRVRSGLKRSRHELIQLAMGLVNITMRCSTAAQLLLGSFWPSYTSHRELCSMLAFLHLFHMCFSFWLTACLCAYYCTAITNPNISLFIWMKRTLSSQLRPLLLFSGLGSFVVTFPLAFSFQIQHHQQFSGNSTYMVWAMSYNAASKAVTSVFGCFLPFFLIFLSIIITVFSLVRHIWRIKNNGSGFAYPKLQAHTNAIRTMLLFLTVSVVFYVCETLLYVGDAINDPMIYIALLIATIFPTAEAFIIIQANPHLWRTILRRFCRVRAQENETHT